MENNDPNAPSGESDTRDYAIPLRTSIGKYRIEGVLGRGGFGITYFAVGEDGSHVAIKEYLPSGIATREGMTSRVYALKGNESLFGEGVKRFRKECEVLKGLSLSNVVKAIDYIEANNTAYLVMEYVQGQTLRQFATARKGASKPLSEAEVVAILRPILSGLVELHAARADGETLLHRDIKPDNIVLRHDDGVPVLIDFGAARLSNARTTHVLSKVFAPGFSPPEMLSSTASQGPWTDLYALGATMWFLLAGGEVPPNSTDRQQKVFDQLPDPLEPASKRFARDGYSKRLLGVIDKLLSISAKGRPQSASVALSMLDGKTTIVQGGFEGGRRRLTRPLLGATAALALIGLVGGALAFPEKVRSAWRDVQARLGMIELHPVLVNPSPPETEVRISGAGVDQKWVPGTALPEGRYRLDATAEFHAPKSLEIGVPLAAPIALHLDRRQVRLEVKTTPADAKVAIEGREGFRSGQEVPAGEWTVHVSAPLHESQERRLTLAGDRREEFALDRKRFSLTVQPTPENAIVKLTQPVESYSPGMTLPAGQVRLEISADGYKTAARTVTLDRDLVVPVSMSKSCRMVTTVESQCTTTTTTNFETKSERSEDWISAEGEVTGAWRDWPQQVCTRAKTRARRELENECDGSLRRVEVAECDCDTEYRSNPFVGGGVDGKPTCRAEATGRCTTTQETEIPVSKPVQSCEDVPVQKEVCD